MVEYSFYVPFGRDGVVVAVFHDVGLYLRYVVAPAAVATELENADVNSLAARMWSAGSLHTIVASSVDNAKFTVSPAILRESSQDVFWLLVLAQSRDELWASCPHSSFVMCFGCCAGRISVSGLFCFVHPRQVREACVRCLADVGAAGEGDVVAPVWQAFFSGSDAGSLGSAIQASAASLVGTAERYTEARRVGLCALCR